METQETLETLETLETRDQGLIMEMLCSSAGL